MKTNKYIYETILQQNNGNGWDDIETFETNSTHIGSNSDRKELNRLKVEYRIAQPNAPLRIIYRKTKATSNPI